jgi:hypothetical protein
MADQLLARLQSGRHLPLCRRGLSVFLLGYRTQYHQSHVAELLGIDRSRQAGELGCWVDG